MLVLLIEDDKEFGTELVEVLRREGYDVDWEKTGPEGLYKATEWEYDLVILDRMLPGQDGISLLRDLRGVSTVPVLMLTALGTARERVEGLDSGADDYLPKPFELEELLARMRALTRRASGQLSTQLTWKDVTLDMKRRTLTRSGRIIALSRNELIVAEVLLLRKGTPVSIATLNDRVNSDEKELRSNAIEVMIHRIRQKVGHDFIKTRRGLGYQIPHDRDES